MTIQTKTIEKTSILYLCDRFDFSQQAEFRHTYENLPKNNNFVLDFSKTKHIDSAALGMLLLLRDYAGGDNAKIEFTRCQSEIKNIFRISNFGKIFDIK